MISDVEALELAHVNYLALVPRKHARRRHDEDRRFDDLSAAGKSAPQPAAVV